MEIKHREIPKLVQCPPLNSRLIQLLTKLCFRPDNKLRKTDVVLVLGNHDHTLTAQNLARLLDKKISQWVVISGGNPQFTDSPDRPKTEAEIILSGVNPKKYPQVKFDLETEASNTRQNVEFAINKYGLDKTKSICYLFLAHTSQRAYLSLRKFLPRHQLIQTTFNRTDPETGTPISAKLWPTTKQGRDRVWAEYLRIKLYGERGDIAYPKNIKHLVDQTSLAEL